MNERIKKILEELGLKRVDFANRLHISQPFASELCSGAKSPSERTISDICREFGVNESWLRTGEGEMFAAPTAASDKIMDFAAEIARNDDKEFRKRLVVMLAEGLGTTRAYSRKADNVKKRQFPKRLPLK